MAEMTDQELREKILKDGLVRSEIMRWKKSDGEPVRATHQPIVEIGVDDLMRLITQYGDTRERLGRIDELASIEVDSDGVASYWDKSSSTFIGIAERKERLERSVSPSAELNGEE